MAGSHADPPEDRQWEASALGGDMHLWPPSVSVHDIVFGPPRPGVEDGRRRHSRLEL